MYYALFFLGTSKYILFCCIVDMTMTVSVPRPPRATSGVRPCPRGRPPLVQALPVRHDQSARVRIHKQALLQPHILSTR